MFELQAAEPLAQRIRQDQTRRHPADVLAMQQAVYQRLGLLPAGADYGKLLAGLAAGARAAYYDHRKRRLYVDERIQLPLQQAALIKELCHALQHRRLRAGRLLRPVKDNRDRQLARLALVQGDCTGVLLEYLLAPHKWDLSSLSGEVGALVRRAASGGRKARLASAPPLIRETLLFPLVAGTQFIQRVRARHPWAVVDKIYRRPPASTEQVLHPDKYWRREQPVRIRPAELPALAGAHKRVFQDVLGELMLRLMLRQAVAPSIARRAAEGWGGDLLEVYQPTGGGPLMLVHLSSWDSDADALEYSNTLRRLLIARKYRRADAASNPWVHTEDRGTRWSVQLHQQHVLLLGGFPPELRRKLQREVWERWRVRGRRVRPPVQTTQTR